MIPIAIYPEPAYFNKDVRIKGNLWIAENPKNKKYPAYWTRCLDDLAKLQGRICCYYGIYIEPNSGAETIDHFLPKYKYCDLVYEWQNYRYCCLSANRKKHIFEDVIDPTKLPLEIGKHTFEIDFAYGTVRANPDLLPNNIEKVNATIERLNLNGVKCQGSRITAFWEYIVSQNVSQEYLQKRFPFVYEEAKRQGLL